MCVFPFSNKHVPSTTTLLVDGASSMYRYIQPVVRSAVLGGVDGCVFHACSHAPLSAERGLTRTVYYWTFGCFLGEEGRPSLRLLLTLSTRCTCTYEFTSAGEPRLGIHHLGAHLCTTIYW